MKPVKPIQWHREALLYRFLRNDAGDAIDKTIAFKTLLHRLDFNSGIGKYWTDDKLLEANVKWMHKRVPVTVPECLSVRQYMDIVNASPTDGGE